MKEPLWLSLDIALAIHDAQLAEQGGLSGVRSAHALQAAITRPKNLFFYEAADIFSLAAAYTFGIAMNHPFSDGNKRTAFVCGAVFLDINGIQLTASEEQAVEVMLTLASSGLSQKELAIFYRENSKKG